MIGVVVKCFFDICIFCVNNIGFSVSFFGKVFFVSGVLIGVKIFSIKFFCLVVWYIFGGGVGIVGLRLSIGFCFN